MIAAAAYVAIAVAFSWPLPVKLATHVTGAPEGDTGIYIWNQWVFRHELVDRHSDPYFTELIFRVTGRANLGLHNYTILANVLALPFIKPLGVLTTFNLVYLALSVLSAMAMMALVLEISPAARAEAWLAGVLFAWSTMLVTRGAGHFSLVAAPALPLFLLWLHRVDRNRRLRDAAMAGAMIALAFWSDVYYAVYCVLLAIGYVGVQVVNVTRVPRPSGPTGLIVAIDSLAFSLAGVIAAIALTHGWEFRAFGAMVRMKTLFTPMLALTALLIGRWFWHLRTELRTPRPLPASRLLALAAAGITMAVVLLAPTLHALAIRVAAGEFVSPRPFWRSSPAGVDLLAFFVPNPNHPLAPVGSRSWLSMPMLELEHISSVPLTVVAAVGAAWGRGWRPQKFWIAVAISFGLLSLGPFVHIAGVNTYVPGPWALLRYVPLIGLARTPARMTVVVMLAAAMLFALAVATFAPSMGGE